jgi:hypothetical protein
VGIAVEVGRGVGVLGGIVNGVGESVAVGGRWMGTVSVGEGVASGAMKWCAPQPKPQAIAPSAATTATTIKMESGFNFDIGFLIPFLR